MVAQLLNIYSLRVSYCKSELKKRLIVINGGNAEYKGENYIEIKTNMCGRGYYPLLAT